jgi:hypothetical protein
VPAGDIDLSPCTERNLADNRQDRNDRAEQQQEYDSSRYQCHSLQKFLHLLPPSNTR